jgi:SulP family sulfate permease
MQSLLSAVVCANLTGVRPNSNKELVGQGVGNVVSSLFGGLSGAGSVSGTMTNYEAGGRTPASGMISGLASLVVIGALGHLVGKIPLTVIAGIVIAVGITIIDKQTLTLLRRPANLFKQRKYVLKNLAVNLLVAVITVTVNLLVAVAVGVAIATAMFVSKIGKSVINRKFTGDITHSKKVRNLTQQDILQDIGREIVIFELNGPLFFGSADKLASEIEISMEDATYCILDMKRVNEIDSTGVDILIQIIKMLEKKKKRLLIAHLKEKPSLWEPVEAFDVVKTLREDHFFYDTDTALEWAEDHLLVQKGFLPDEHAAALLSKMDIVKGFSSDELNVFRENLALKKVKKGQLVIVEGDPGTDMFLLLKGSVSVKLRLAGGDRSKRLVSFSPGVIFGEMALLDEGPRSADVVADEDSEMFQLSLSNFQILRRDHPALATKLILNMALWLSERLRALSQEVRLMEDA